MTPGHGQAGIALPIDTVAGRGPADSLSQPWPSRTGSDSPAAGRAAVPQCRRNGRQRQAIEA
jgi:hypothetical protein